ncbi:MAG TPA: glycosyltransferase [Micromonosporaceae bacterium]
MGEAAAAGARAGTGVTGDRTSGGRLDVEYVLPLRRSDADGDDLAELTGYLGALGRWVDVTVVDGSPGPVYRRHADAWSGLVRQVPPDPDLRYRNGKVNGVLTGVRAARHERVVIADDDVRYRRDELVAVAALLDDVDLVRPQNYFAPTPWHARWDTARTLLNRCLGGDYPGTFGLRRGTLLAAGGYDGDVLFENLELIRTVRAVGGTEARPLDLYVRRLAPDPARFFGQRVRQAYDDFAQPVRAAVFLAVLPGVLALLAARRRKAVVVPFAASVALAEVGRRRGGGARVFPATSSLLAPAWVGERAVCIWLALGRRLLRGGVRYSGRRLRLAAHRQAYLRGRLRPAR